MDKGRGGTGLSNNAGGLSLRSLARALGGEVAGSQALAPGPGHSPRDRSLSIRLSATAPEGFIAFSHSGDDFATCRDYVKQALGIDTNTWRRHEPQQPRAPTLTAAELDERERAADRTRRLITAYLRELVPLIGTPGERYLREIRKIDTDAIIDVLERVDGIGWHPSVYFNEPERPGHPRHPLHGRSLGCIVGVMTDTVTGEPTGAISRTYLHEGRKVAKAKTLGSPAGIIRLSEDTDVLYGLHLSEGLETGLDAMARGWRPIWSTGSKSLMAKLPILLGIEALTIFADNDEDGGGLGAAHEAAERWLAAGREVHVYQRETTGDLNDAYREVKR